jgi:hypothetical protein
MKKKLGHPMTLSAGRSVPHVTESEKQPGTLKQLARKVLSSTSSLSQTYTRGTPGQQRQQRDKLRDTGGTDELSLSARRLESANLSLAISEGSILRIVQTDTEAHQASTDGFTIYTPKDAYMYVILSERERRLLHKFKKNFGGTIEWKASSHQRPLEGK